MEEGGKEERDGTLKTTSPPNPQPNQACTRNGEAKDDGPPARNLPGTVDLVVVMVGVVLAASG